MASRKKPKGKKRTSTQRRPKAGKKRSSIKHGRGRKTTARKSTKRAVPSRIFYIPNDPVAVVALPGRLTNPRPERPRNRAGFAFEASPAPAGQYAPGTDEFLFWQSRESALAAVEAFEGVAGPLAAWAREARSPLALRRNGGMDLNAYYDRHSVSFFQHSTSKRTTFSGASTDVVAHEVGHAILDALRPDLWGSNLPEHGAFHEAFGDCLAILTAFADPPTCRALLTANTTLKAANFVEATAEDLSAGVRAALGVAHPASQPRRALNAYKWVLPSTLPISGGPAVLTGEVHSFARVFTGAFYDTIRFIFASYNSQTATTLASAARTAGALLVQAARTAVEQARFFRAVGEAMLQADAASNGAANQAAIMGAFERHGIELAQPGRAFQKRGVLARSRRTRVGAIAKKGGPSTQAIASDLKARLGARPESHMQRVPFALGAERLEKLVHQREVRLDNVDTRLRGVVAKAPEAVVGSQAEAGFVFRSAVPDSGTTDDEVRYFVEMLLGRGSIQTAPTKTARVLESSARQSTPPGRRAFAANVSAKPSTQESDIITHVVHIKKGKKVLERVRFACGCCRG